MSAGRTHARRRASGHRPTASTDRHVAGAAHRESLGSARFAYPAPQAVCHSTGPARGTALVAIQQSHHRSSPCDGIRVDRVDGQGSADSRGKLPTIWRPRHACQAQRQERRRITTYPVGDGQHRVRRRCRTTGIQQNHVVAWVLARRDSPSIRRPARARPRCRVTRRCQRAQMAAVCVHEPDARKAAPIRFERDRALVRGDLYHNQPCDSTGDPYIFRPVIGYYECLHAVGD